MSTSYDDALLFLLSRPHPCLESFRLIADLWQKSFDSVKSDYRALKAQFN